MLMKFKIMDIVVNPITTLNYFVKKNTIEAYFTFFWSIHRFDNELIEFSYANAHLYFVFLTFTI